MFSALACMAVAIYFEARAEPIVGQFAVANVIMNRVWDKRYPDEICEVVKQGKLYSKPTGKVVINQCQFSFYCDGKSDSPEDMEAFQVAIEISRNIQAGVWYDPTEGATHYHSIEITPVWAKTKTRVVRIENHVFYRWEENKPDRSKNVNDSKSATWILPSKSKT